METFWQVSIGHGMTVSGFSIGRSEEKGEQPKRVMEIKKVKCRSFLIV